MDGWMMTLRERTKYRLVRNRRLTLVKITGQFILWAGSKLPWSVVDGSIWPFLCKPLQTRKLSMVLQYYCHFFDFAGKFPIK